MFEPAITRSTGPLNTVAGGGLLLHAARADQPSRQALPQAEGVSIEPIARELAESIIARRADRRLKWQGGGTAHVLMAKMFPYDSGYMQTVTGRRKRLRVALGESLAVEGWREARRDVYSKRRWVRN
jgi:hypothetical protein